MRQSRATPTILRAIAPVFCLLAAVPMEAEPFRATPTWFRRARMCNHWLWPAEYASTLYSREELIREIDWVASAGYTCMVTGLPLGGRGILGIDDDEIIEQMTMVCDLAHERGLKVMFHYVTLNIKELTKAYHGLSQVDAKTGEPVDFRHPREPMKHYFWALCPNNPAVRRAHTENLVRFFRETGMNGFFTDLVWRKHGRNRQTHSCVCRHCRTAFKTETGIDLPETFDESFYGNYGNHDFVTWHLWREKELGEFIREINRELEKVDPEIVVTAYEAGAPGGVRRNLPWPIEQCAGLDALGFEDAGAFVHYYGWPTVISRFRYAIGVGDAHGMQTYWFAKSASVSEDFFNWSMTVANRARLMNFQQANARLRRVKRDYWLWEERNWRWLAHPDTYKDTAVYYSSLTRDRHALADWWSYTPFFLGWSQALLETNVPHDILTDAFDGDLSAYRAVIVPSAAMLPPQWVRRLQQYLRTGGTVIATLESGALTPNSPFPVDATALQSPSTDAVEVRITDADMRRHVGAGSVLFNGPRLSCRVPEGGHVAGRIGDAPAIVTQAVGAGQLIYLALGIGKAVYQHPALKGRDSRVTAAALEQLRRWLRVIRVLVDGYAGACRLQTVDWPADVAVFVNHHRAAEGETDAPREWLSVHLIHAPDYRLKPGQAFPRFYDVPVRHRRLDGAELRLQLPNERTISTVRLLTLDDNVSQEVAWEQIDGDAALRPTDVCRYSLIVAELR